jgi:hypothetical protein
VRPACGQARYPLGRKTDFGVCCSARTASPNDLLGRRAAAGQTNALQANRAASVAEAMGRTGFTLGIGPSHETLVRDVYGLSYDRPGSSTEDYVRIVTALVRAQLTALLNAGATDIWAATFPVGDTRDDRIASLRRTTDLLTLQFPTAGRCR